MIKLISIKNILLFAACLVFSSCKTRHAATSSAPSDRVITLKEKEPKSYPIGSNTISLPEIGDKKSFIKTTSVELTDAARIINTAKTYIGTPYHYGGTSHKGMDCSGLVYTVYDTIDKKLPRSSFAMSGEGKIINENEVQKGDLIFFKTLNRTRINHVGIVSRVEDGVIYFIHASSSLGVIESSLEESYYSQRMVQINRILP